MRKYILISILLFVGVAGYTQDKKTENKFLKYRHSLGFDFLKYRF